MHTARQMTMTAPEHPHPLDHLVLPTADLDVARERLASLGFTVAPPGVHPFGTENCCVYLSDGTFLEPLAVADASVAGEAIAGGNVFVGRDRAYRDRLGEEGFSAVVFGTSDADADHARFIEAGVSAGDRLDFSRPFTDASGKSDTASFRLAFAGSSDAPDAFLFACERVNAPSVDRSALQAHANGVERIVEVVAISDEPSMHGRLIRLAAGASAGANRLVLPNATIALLDRTAFEARFGVPFGQPSTLRFAAIVFSVRDLGHVKPRLAAHGIEHHLHDGHIVVPQAPGQGAVFVFREIA
jgi:hypothetical protein